MEAIDRLRDYQRQTGISAREIAELSDLSESTVRAILSGSRQPTLPTLRKLTVWLDLEEPGWSTPPTVSPNPLATQTVATSRTWGDRFSDWFAGTTDYWEHPVRNSFDWYLTPYLTVLLTLPLGLLLAYSLAFTVMQFLGLQITGLFWMPPLGTIIWLFIGWQLLSGPPWISILAAYFVFLGVPAAGRGSLPWPVKPLAYASVIAIGGLANQVCWMLEDWIMRLLGIPWIFGDRMETYGAAIAAVVSLGSFGVFLVAKVSQRPAMGVE